MDATAQDVLRYKLSVVMPHLDERQRRILAAAEAQAIGYGGITLVASLTGMSRSTVQDGATELEAGLEVTSRVRRPGGGRKALTETDPGLLPALKALVDPDTRGDPESTLRWTAKSTRTLAGELTAAGHPVNQHTVGGLLHGLGFSLQSTSKTKEGTSHPDRDAQFRYLNQQAIDHLSQGQPVISVDTKKKELVGSYANKGQEWQPEGERKQVNVYDFIDPSVGKAIPGSTMSDPTKDGFRSGSTTTPQPLPFRPSAGGGRWWAHSFIPGGQAADLSRWWRVQRIPQPAMEVKAWPIGPAGRS